MFLVPALIALHRSLSGGARTLSATGSGIAAVTIPILGVLDIIQGRLVYPVFGYSATDPNIAAFVIAVFYGGLRICDSRG